MIPTNPPAPRPARPGSLRRTALLLLLALAAGAQEGARDPSARDLEPLTLGEHVFHRRELANGLRAAAVADEEDSVSVFMVIGAGKRQEGSTTTGLAHLTEHAMYTGTPTTGPDQHDRRVKEMGGQSNAFTREDYTLYYDHGVPIDRLGEVLAMEADRLRNLSFDEAAVLHERGRLEREEAATHTPAMAREELLESVLFRSHPYGAGLLDEEGHTLAPRLSVAQIRHFYDLYYHPDNVAVVVVGGLEPSVALDAVQAAFGQLPRGPARPPVPIEPDRLRGGSARFASELSQDRLEHAWLVPAIDHPDRPALDVLARLLSRRTLSDGAPVQAASGGRVDREIFRLAGTGPRAAAELKALEEELRAALLAEDEVNEVKALLRDDFTAPLLRDRPYLALAGTWGVFEVLGHPEYPVRYAEAIDAVTPEDLREAARRHLTAERRFEIVFEGSGEPPPPLPEDPKELSQVAQDARASGDLERAVAAYTRLLEQKPNKMFTVIYHAERGQVRMEQRDYLSAIADFEEALAVIDYPAVRDLLQEARELQYGGAPIEESDEPEPPAELLARIASVQRELEAWRGLEFRVPIELELASDPAVGTACWYEWESGKLGLSIADGDDLRRSALLEACFHALQDQHFDVAALRQAAGEDEDAGRALSALIEGEAILAVSEITGYDLEPHGRIPAVGAVDEYRFEEAFHLGAGMRFVRAARERGGWKAVAELYRRPPRSTAEILHPERYPAAPPEALDDVELPDRIAREQTRWGEYGLLWLLSECQETRSAAGDLARTLTADRHCLVFTDTGHADCWDLRFESEAAARRFQLEGAPAIAAGGWTLVQSGRDVRLTGTR